MIQEGNKVVQLEDGNNIQHLAIAIVWFTPWLGFDDKEINCMTESEPK